MSASIDLIKGGTVAPNTVAHKLLNSGFNVNALRTNDILRKDEWIDLDTVVVEAARERLVGAADLMQAGLTYNLNNALGKTKHEYQKVSDLQPASISMSGITETSADLLEFDTGSLPIPIIHKDFHLNVRQLEASRSGGESIDAMQARLAGRVVAEKIEDLIFDGATLTGTNNQIYGYRTAVNRNTGSTTADWNTATGAQIVGDTLTAIAAAEADLMFGPYMLYVSRAAYTHMGDDYKAESDKTILQRVKEIPGIIDVRPTHKLGNGEIVLVQMTSDVVDLIEGIQPTIVEWQTHGGMVFNFKVIAIIVPRIRSDFEGRSGIVHLT